MPYREEKGALKARRLSLQSEIAPLGDRARELPYLELKKRELQRELDALPDPDAKPSFLRRHRRPLLRAAIGVASALAAVSALIFAIRPVVHMDGNGQSAADLAPVFPIASPPIDYFEPITLPPQALDHAGISIDFVGSGTSLSVDEVAGIVPLARWNALRNSVGSNATLVDALGAAIAFTQVSWKSGDGWFDAQADDPGSHMFSGYIEQNGAPDVQGTVAVSVSRVPQALVAGDYAVVVYSDKMGNPEDQVTRIELTAGRSDQVFYLRDAAFHDYPLRSGTHGYVVATGTRDERSRTPTANCAIFENQWASNFEIHVSTTRRLENNTGGYLRSPINGIQIVPMTALAKISLQSQMPHLTRVMAPPASSDCRSCTHDPVAAP